MSFWKTRTHNLDRMTLKELVRAFFSYYTVHVYLVLAVASAIVAVIYADGALRPFLAVPLTLVVYPLVEYLLHRFVLHGRYLYRSRWTAAAWKRIHFDHHQDPNDLRVLFGALYTTLPTIALITFALGALIDGLPGAAASFATGLLVFTFYEFCHCAQHLNHMPKSNFLQRIKRHHLAHHFHNEAGNFGITSFFWDQFLGTYYAKPKERPRSATVFNIGYTAAEAARYPWVAELSNGMRRDGSPRGSPRPFGRATSE